MITPIITLTSDFGTKDYFVGAIKGQIYSELDSANIVDVTHQITPFSINEAAYVIKNAYKHFPKGSIHIIAVDAEYSLENKHVAIQLDDHYFICADNGVISLLSSEINPQKMVEITIQRNEGNKSFLADFISTACHISRGGNLDLIGRNITQIKQIQEVKPFINNEQNQIIGHVIYIDNFGNVISNINKKIFNQIGKGRKFEVNTRSYTFTNIHENYNEVVNYELSPDKRNDDGKRLAIFNSVGFLEIAIYRSNLQSVGGASSLLGLKYRDTITVRFF
jgi:S-adenosylmethionine hydrolase